MRFMLKTGIRSWIALGCALGLGAFAYVLVSRPTEQVALEAPSGANEGDVEPAASTPSRNTFGAEPSNAEARKRGPRQQGDDVRPEEDDDWDELSGAERRARLEGDFSRAVEELEAGGGSPQVVAQAEGALSELRAQMYSTPSGRKEHEALEERLSMVTEERRGGDVDDEK